MTQTDIAITGATGFIGQHLAASLAQADDPPSIRVLSRHPDVARKIFTAIAPDSAIHGYDPMDTEQIAAAIDGCTGVVHLAGAPIASRWTPENRAAIRDSRVAGTRALVAAIASLGTPPEVLISPSACRIYGTSETARFDETSPPAPRGDFLGDICQDWEAAANAATDSGVRVVILRAGIVLGLTEDGRRMIDRMRPFLGGRIGTGRQWTSWIHRDDFVRIIMAALARPSMDGVYNATAPQPARMMQVTDAFARNAGSLIRVPVPGRVLREVLGDAATTILDGQRVHPDRLVAEGFSFRFTAIGPAVQDVLAPRERPAGSTADR